MSNVAKLKKKAAEFEQKKQFDKALQTYIQILDSDKLEDADVALYNRVGDLLLRQGDVAQAVDYYEKAVDLYSDGGFFNNAIALCNKILRNSPGRNSIYYKLGKISARKGFTSDAKQNFLEYADRMQKAGQMDEAFRALKEFADLCPDQDDIRLMLAEQLSKKNRKGEALEQLQTLYEKFESEGRAAEARATIDRMKAIDPEAQPKVTGGDEKKQKSNELIFLEVEFDKPARGKGAPPPSPGRDSGASRARDLPPEPPNPVADLPLIDTETFEPAATAEAPPAELRTDFTPPPDLPPELQGDGGLIVGFEQTNFGSDATAAPNDFDVGFGGNILDLDRPRVDHSDGAPSPHDLSLHGDLPMLELPSDVTDGLQLFQPTEITEDSRETRAFVDSLTPRIERESRPDLGVSSEFLQLEVGAESLLDGLTLDPDPLADPVPDSTTPSLDDGLAPLAEAPPEPPPLPPVTEPTHAHRPASAAGTSALARVELLRDQVRQDEQNPSLRRQYAEALLELGEREGGLHELELAMIAFERSGDLDSAESVADEIIRLDPNSVRHHQKRVEYAFRTSDRSRLVDAYLELADSLFRTGQADKARAVYQRVLELAPDDIRAQAALSAFIDPVPPAPAPKKERREQSGTFRRYTADLKKNEPEPSREPAPGSDDDFVDLGAWLREDKGGKSTRMVVEEQAPTGDEEADFADMLKRFKQGVAENVEDEDHESHYDLGVAYKEMGLLDEAIGEFQKALRGTEHRVRTYEALGLCFLEKSQFQVARTVLARALGEGGVPDDQLVGVLYLLGYACEGLQRWEEALGYYQRVFAVDIEFRDVAQRIAALERVIA